MKIFGGKDKGERGGEGLFRNGWPRRRLVEWTVPWEWWDF